MQVSRIVISTFSNFPFSAIRSTSLPVLVGLVIGFPLVAQDATIPWLTGRPSQTEERKAAMSTLMNWGPSTKYALGLLNLMGQLDYRAADDPLALRPAVSRTYWPKVEVPPELKGAFEVETHAQCVMVSGLNKPLPIPAAQFFADSFASGFACRMILARAIASNGILDVDLSISVSDEPNQALDVSLGRYLDKVEYGWKPAQGERKDKTGKVTKKAKPEKKITADMYKDGLARLMQEENVAASGILWGWTAATALESERVRGDDKPWSAAEKLLSWRYTPEELGMMTSFTLTYIAGFSSAAELKRKAGASADDTLRFLSDDADPSSAIELTSNLYRALQAEYSTLLSADSISLSDSESGLLSDEERERLIASYFEFMAGFQLGASTAADRLYRDAFAQGYGLGYQQGFKDGYTMGYAAGRADGFARGYKKAWSEAGKKITALNTKLDQLQKHRDGQSTGRGRGWLERTVNAGKKVFKVGKTIAGLFGF